jgi:hypothetical protein
VLFRFAKEHVNDAMAACRERASATRRESANLRYEIYRGIDDDQEFYARGALGLRGCSGRARTDRAFIRFGQGLLAKHATLHDTVTARPF